MKKVIFVLALFFTCTIAFTSCRDNKTPDEKVEAALEEVKEDAEYASDDVQDALEDVQDEIEEVKEESKK